MDDDDIGARNMRLLVLSFSAFGTFALAQFVFSILANSLALLGDSVAMMVDTVTYGLNLAAENVKRKRGGRLSNRERILYEIYVPGFSLICLVVLITVIGVSSVKTLLRTEKLNDVDENVAIAFAGLNIVVDFICLISYVLSCESYFVMGSALMDEDFGKPQPSTSSSMFDDRNVSGGGMIKNANMCAAFTHVIADTIRSVTVLIAAIWAKTHPSKSSNNIDSVAALIVCVILMAVILPFLMSLRQKYVFYQRKMETSDDFEEDEESEMLL